MTPLRRPTVRALPRLASMPDGEIARLLRRSFRLGDPGKARPKAGAMHRWSAAEEHLLGRYPDAQLAKRLGRSVRSVGFHRRMLGIKLRYTRCWTKAEDRLLAPSLKSHRGRHATRLLAKRLGRSLVAVQQRRRKKFGLALPTPRRWSRHEDRLLGTRTDAEVAVLIGRTKAAVMLRRTRLGILPRTIRRRWTPAEDRLLGTAPDTVVARRLAHPLQSVTARRRKLGIACPPRPGAWPPEEERLLGTLPDREIARRLGRTLVAVQIRRRLKGLPSLGLTARPWTAREDKLLGTQPDAQIARLLGRTRAAVQARRCCKLGIPMVRADGARGWTAAAERSLGSRPDSELARRLGRSEMAVALKRQRLGRPPYGPSKPHGPRRI